MHRYASPIPEARELVSELEFVWDQIKSNTSSSSSSSPLRRSSTSPPLRTQPSYASIGGHVSRGQDSNTGGPARDSRLRVLSPVSQADEDLGQKNYAAEQGEDDEDEEEYQEARDAIHDDNPDELDDDRALRRNWASKARVDDETYNRKWRRRVEQALTKMTTEIAAMREQMETRARYNRRKGSLWAWLKWLVWVAMRQIFWDIAILGAVLLWMRLRGDRRAEERLKIAWVEVRRRLAKLRLLRRLPRILLLP
jgi:hypothetical protein